MSCEVNLEPEESLMKSSKKTETSLKIGIAGFHRELVGTVHFFEIDSHDPLLESKRSVNRLRTESRELYELNISANHYYFRKNSPLTLEDRALQLLELCENLNAKECVLKLTPSFFDLYTIEESIDRFHQIWCTETKKNLLVDLPAYFPKSLLVRSNYILDPCWHKITQGGYWRIHGWHDARWVRRYSEDALSKLAKNCLRFKPMALVFAHSQRVSQVQEFLKKTPK
jgi:hypothetical protein